MSGFGLARVKREGTRVWCGDYGDYEVPPELMSIRYSKNTGRPDRRYRADYIRFMAWVNAQEQKAKEKING